MIEHEDSWHDPAQNEEIVIDDFSQAITQRGVADYCKAASAQVICSTYDDTCEIAAALLQTLQSKRADEF